MEVWTKVPNETDYEVSNHGRARNKKGKILKEFLTNGYSAVGFKDGGRYVHRLVARLYCPRGEDHEQVNHKDCDRTNNHWSNLEWCTPSENCWHYVSQGRGAQKPYHLIDPEGNEHTGVNLNALCREHNLQQPNLKNVNNGRRRMHKGWTRGGVHV